MAEAIARFEPVIMLANEGDVAQAQALCGPSVKVQAAPIDDGWFRDNGPSFVIDGQGKHDRRGLGFQRLGPNKPGIPFARDRAVTKLILAREGIARVAAPLVLEGGSFHVDGVARCSPPSNACSTRTATRAFRRAEIEQQLKDHLGVDKVIWLNRGVVDDFTDGHIDLLAALRSRAWCWRWAALTAPTQTTPPSRKIWKS